MHGVAALLPPRTGTGLAMGLPDTHSMDGRKHWEPAASACRGRNAMDFFDFEFDFQDCLGAMLACMFLLGSMQLHAVLNDEISEHAGRLQQAQEISPAPV